MRLRDKAGEAPLATGARVDASFSHLMRTLLSGDAPGARASKPAMKSVVCPAVTKAGEPCRNRIPVELGEALCSTHRRGRRECG